MNEEQTLYLERVDAMIRAMSEEQRLELFNRYCIYCGDIQPFQGIRCQCWNDE